MAHTWGRDGSGPEAHAASAIGRGADHGIAALSLAALLVLGGLMGSLNLLIDGVVRSGAPRWLYAATMLLCLLAAVPLAVRQRAGRWAVFGLVLLGDLMYVVVALSIVDATRFATPLILLFSCFLAAWFVSPRMLLVHLAVVPVVCLVALWSSYDSPATLAVQVVVSAGVLNAATLGVFVQRRRFERLLIATQELSRTDPLTGLANRRDLEEQAPRTWRQARRDGTQVAALVLDLDRFKQLNDAYGHAAGDAVLRAVAASLTGMVRPSDVLARTGGEELVVLGLVADQGEAAHLAERLREAVTGTRARTGHRVTASIGVALTRPLDGENTEDALWQLIDRADAAMYAAKQQGRDRVAAAAVAQLPTEPPAEPDAEPPAETQPGARLGAAGPTSDVA